MATEDVLRRSRPVQRLQRGPHGTLVELFAGCLLADGLTPHGARRSLNLLSGLLSWLASSELQLADLDEEVAESYLRDRSAKQTLQPGEPMRLLSTLRRSGAIAPAHGGGGHTARGDLRGIQRLFARGTRAGDDVDRASPAVHSPVPP
jgi:hypothetical protein